MKILCINYIAKLSKILEQWFWTLRRSDRDIVRETLQDTQIIKRIYNILKENGLSADLEDVAIAAEYYFFISPTFSYSGMVPVGLNSIQVPYRITGDYELREVERAAEDHNSDWNFTARNLFSNFIEISWSRKKQ